MSAKIFNLDEQGILQAEQKNGYLQLILNQSTPTQSNFDKFTPEQHLASFISGVCDPSKYVFTDYFKQRFHILSCSFIIDPRSFGQYLRDRESGNSNHLKDEFGGKSLPSNYHTATVLTRGGMGNYQISHHHIDAYQHAFIHNLNNYFRKKKINTYQDILSCYKDAVANQNEYKTGEWVLYKDFNDVRYYLDVTTHGDDNHIQNEGLHHYLSEVGFIF
jgi:hypothetical protein